MDELYLAAEQAALEAASTFLTWSNMRTSFATEREHDREQAALLVTAANAVRAGGLQ